MSLQKLKAILMMNVVFALGAIVGASWGGILVSRRVIPAYLSPDPMKPRITEELKSRLKLSAEQAERVESILSDAQGQFRQLHLAVKPQFEEIRQRMRAGIRQMLNETQKREYETMIREHDDRREKEKRQRAARVSS